MMDMRAMLGLFWLYFRYISSSTVPLCGSDSPISTMSGSSNPFTTLPSAMNSGL